jgi:uncharacterized protein YciI
MNWYLYKLIPPRPDFSRTMTPAERQAMMAHVVYWRGHTDAGRVLIFTPVADPVGDWGLAVVRAKTMDDVRSLGDNDPAVVASVGRYEVVALPGAVIAA